MVMETDNGVPERNTLFKTFIVIVVIAFFINLVAVNFVLYKQLTQAAHSPVVVATTPSPTPIANVCDRTCVLAIVKEATASIKIPTPAPTIRILKTVAPTSIATPRELFLSIGSGMTAAGDWNDVSGLEVTVNSALYGSIKNAYFEATLSIPSTEGIAYARLYNVTDGVFLANSDVSTTNSSPTFLISQPIALEGTKVYKVQMKSTQIKNAVLSQSRIRIVQN